MATDSSYPFVKLIIVPPLVLLFQSSLCQIPPRPSSSETGTPHRYLRLALLPICVYLIQTSCDIMVKPERAFILFNVVIQIARVWAIGRSIEFACVHRETRQWIGYDEAYRQGPVELDGRETKANGGPEHVDKGNPLQSRDLWTIVRYGWADVCSLRGIGWSWGIRGVRIPSPHPPSHLLASLLIRMAWSQSITMLGVAFFVASRQHGGPDVTVRDVLSFLLLPFCPRITRTPFLHSSSFQTLSGYLLVFSLGLAIYSSLELGYTCFTLAIYLLTALFRLLLPSRLAPAPFESRAWPRLMRAPYLSTSIHEFWAKRWHHLFTRPFTFLGIRPARWMMYRLGAPNFVEEAAGMMAAFAVSGLLHEAYNSATPWQPRDPYYVTFIFFLVQSIGLFVERGFQMLTGRKLYGLLGYIWTFAWLLITAQPVSRLWMERGLADFAPAIETWEWWRWALPMGCLFPRLLQT